MKGRDAAALKREAGRQAAGEVRSGMTLGLGTGSTVAWFLEALAARLEDGSVRDVVGVPTSVATEERARALDIPLGSLSDLQPLDLTVDGADEIAPSLDLVKGLGGALLREKMVAQASHRMIVIADDSKLVDRLGEKAPVPVEVVRFEWRAHLAALRELGAEPVLRRVDGTPVVTDNGNYLLDCHVEGAIDHPAGLERALAGRAGIVASGLFLGLATEAFVASREGVRALGASEPSAAAHTSDPTPERDTDEVRDGAPA